MLRVAVFLALRRIAPGRGVRPRPWASATVEFAEPNLAAGRKGTAAMRKRRIRPDKLIGSRELGETASDGPGYHVTLATGRVASADASTEEAPASYPYGVVGQPGKYVLMSLVMICPRVESRRGRLCIVKVHLPRLSRASFTSVCKARTTRAPIKRVGSRVESSAISTARLMTGTRSARVEASGSGSLLTSERARGMPGSSGVICSGVRDDATSAVSRGAGPAGGVCGAV